MPKISTTPYVHIPLPTTNRGDNLSPKSGRTVLPILAAQFCQTQIWQARTAAIAAVLGRNAQPELVLAAVQDQNSSQNISSGWHQQEGKACSPEQKADPTPGNA